MNTFINFHVLRNSPASNPNRDREKGQGKRITFGGVVRSRLSSQSLNYVLRRQLEAACANLPAIPLGQRTCELANLVAQQLSRNPEKFSASELAALPHCLAKFFGKGEKDKKEKKAVGSKTPMMFITKDYIGKVEEVVYKFKQENPEVCNGWLDPEAVLQYRMEQMLSPSIPKDRQDYIKANVRPLCDFVSQVDSEKEYNKDDPSEAFLKVVVKYVEDNDLGEIKEAVKKAKVKKVKGDKVKKVKGAKIDDLEKEILGLYSESDNALDIALMGRMLAAANDKNNTAALTTAHAFGVNELHEETDFFSAFDDVLGSAGHLGDNYLSSSLFYMYFSLNLGDLKKNFPIITENREVFEKTVEILVKAISDCFPQGRSTKTAGDHSTILGMLVEVITDGLPIYYINAYDRPVRGGSQGGYNEEAMKRLLLSSNSSQAVTKAKRIWYSTEDESVAHPSVNVLDLLEGGLVTKNMNKVVARILEAVN